MIDVIKEYLISVGFSVDNQSINNAKNEMSKFEKMLGGFANTIAGKFSIAAVGITAFYETLTVAAGKFANAVAQSDREIELLARRMYTTEANARSLSETMKALGVTSIEQLKDVALNPEFKAQFLELRQLTRSLDNPQNKEFLRYVREINFEFQKLSARVNYFKRDVVSSFARELKPVIDNLVRDLRPLYQDLIKNAPKYANSIGKFLANIAQMGLHIGQAFTNIIKFVKDLPDDIKRISETSAILFFALKTNLGWVFMTLQSIFLMIDDYMVYLKGGKSYYSEVYDILTGKGKKVTDDNESFFDRISKAKKEKGLLGAFKDIWQNDKPLGGVPIYKSKGTDFGNIRIRDDKDIGLSTSLIEFIEALNPYLDGVKSDYIISDGYTNRGSKERGHASGLKMDIGFAGKSFEEQIKLLQAISMQSKLAQSFIEVSSKQEYDKYINVLKSGGYDTSKFDFHETRKGNEHVDIRTVPPDKTSWVINIYESGNARETAREVIALANESGIRANQEAII